MAGDDSTTIVSEIQSLLRLVRDVARTTATGFTGGFKKDCTDLSRRVALLSYLLEEIRDFQGDLMPLDMACSSSSSPSSLSELTTALQAANRLLQSAGSFDHNISAEGTAEKFACQFQGVTWKLEKALANLPYDRFDISEEVKEQVDLVRVQLKRATERYGGQQDPILLLATESDSFQIINIHDDDDGVKSKVGSFTNENLPKDLELVTESTLLKTTHDVQTSPVIPVDFLCPISLEIIKDPVIVSTGQTYERSYIQRWINGGNTTCPKTRQKLRNLTLTPNYVLRNLITQWCTIHKIEHSTLLPNRRLKDSDGSFLDVSIESIIQSLSSQSIEERRAALSKIRCLSKRITENRMIIAESGGIPILVGLLTSEDVTTQEHAVTSILNLSIYDNNRGLIMLENAVPSLVQLLKSGTMETRENAAATLFSLSLSDENKIVIGGSGAIPALVDLLENGSRRGKNDAATALFNLCIYQGNKGRAVRAGIVSVLLKMLTDVNSAMVDEALTLLSILASHNEAKSAMVRAQIIPNLIDFVKSGIPRNKENAASILLSLCKRDDENIGCVIRLEALTPLMELADNGSERGRRKANLLLGHIERFRQNLEHLQVRVD
ncbi:unnamed protein product [Lactuca saligna]|uniref:RING-type E3 ubiquitin transferase n=1 Tax=Lactuca saligna TaxID=75948 RepID=A0AA35YL89_LACSI|nr:unnamed protein product [Lactuca saligna]